MRLPTPILTLARRSPRILSGLLTLLLATLTTLPTTSKAAIGQYHAYPNTNAPDPTDLFLLGSTNRTPATNVTMTWQQISNLLAGDKLLDAGANGLAARTAAGVTASRTITGTGNQISVVNGSGVAGNPTLSTPQNIDTNATVNFANIIAQGNGSYNLGANNIATNISNVLHVGKGSGLTGVSWYYSGVNVLDLVSGALAPHSDNGLDLGAASMRYGSGYFTSDIYTPGTVRANKGSFTNNFQLRGFNSTSNFVWTCTNSTTGEGEWRIAGGGGGIDNSLYTSNPSTATNFVSQLGPYPGTNYLVFATNDLCFVHSTNRPSGYTNFAATWFIEAGNTNRNLLFNASWKFLGATNNILLSSNKVAMLSLSCYGTSETNVLAVWSAQP